MNPKSEAMRRFQNKELGGVYHCLLMPIMGIEKEGLAAL